MKYQRILKNLLIKLLAPVSDVWFTRIIYFLRQKSLLKLKNPQTFNEKITYIKLNHKNDLRHQIADRLKVREYVQNRSPELKLIKVFWTGKEFTEEVYKRLPQEFVIKGNHGSRMVKIVNKSETDYEKLFQSIKGWMDFDYSHKGRERIYQMLDRYYLVEEKLPWGEGIPPDFKFFCFNGRMELVQVDFDRFEKHTRNLYDRSFNKLKERLYLQNGPEIEKPKAFEKAVKIAEDLSPEFSFIRVDLYLIGDEVYFGELTNFPGNGFEDFKPRSFDYYLGEKVTHLH
ncbi:MAG: ATP-grasp fold amidoligase family protein [Anditalea sp.]